MGGCAWGVGEGLLSGRGGLVSGGGALVSGGEGASACRSKRHASVLIQQVLVAISSRSIHRK